MLGVCYSLAKLNGVVTMMIIEITAAVRATMGPTRYKSRAIGRPAINAAFAAVPARKQTVAAVATASSVPEILYPWKTSMPLIGKHRIANDIDAWFSRAG